MPTDAPLPPANRTMLTVVIVAASVATGLAGLGLGHYWSSPKPAPASSVTVIRPSPSVITAIRDLSRLEGAEYHVERVIDLTEKQSRMFGLLETKDAILLVAAGDVTAGVDLAEMRDEDVVVQGKSVKITLPKAKVLSQRLDNERTYVHTRKTDVLAERKESLETRARQEAEKSVTQAALEAGILSRASKNAVRTVESLVKSLGFEQVTVEIRN
jgi:hypothetical protein